MNLIFWMSTERFAGLRPKFKRRSWPTAGGLTARYGSVAWLWFALDWNNET